MEPRSVDALARYAATGASRRQVLRFALGAMGGLAKRAPVFAVIFLIVTMATLAIPGSANFIGEFFILNGVFHVDPALAIIASVGVALAAFYALRMYQLTMHNPLPDGADSREISLRDAIVVIPMVAIVVVLAFAPQLVINEISPATDSTVTMAKELAE